ncbi:putative iron-sulfur cluster insertion protein ErpA [Tetrabaena socialis]|nr:putative iron-sulfur cluster insertion protein ErpA [Tetrabaena socialis]|eukprot:PNG99478.1 putative iron-sulfur cluster insertion protein ErpA [Tetrabaena socialis]
MLSRALHAAALAERILSGSLTGTALQVAGCSAAAVSATWGSQRHAWSAHLPLRRFGAAGFSTATAAAAAEEPGLQIHPSAAARLRELQAQAPGGTLVLRIEVEGGGCSGFQYRFKLDDTVKEDDV